MVIRRYILLLLVSINALIGNVVAQSEQRSVPQNLSYAQYQDSLRQLGTMIYQEELEAERLKANFSFVKTLVAALQAPFSYEQPFEALDMVSIQRSPDDKFRIFSWHVPLSDSSYLYYGTIQIKTPDGSLKLYPLLDQTYEIENPDSAITGSDAWYGAQYYDIIPYQDSYLLLGWKGHNPLITQKVIEVLTLDEERDRAILGKPIFSSPETEHATRIIYRFSRQISMHLAYEKEGNRIVLDHLTPSSVQLEGQFEHYGPDLSFDAWVLGKERLELLSDILF